MKDQHIRPVAETDLQVWMQLERDTFTETFLPVYATHDLQTFLQEKKNDNILRQEWESKDAYFYILWEGTTAAGFIKLNLHRQPDNGTLLPTPVMELERIYVRREFQSKKLGKKLIHFAYEEAHKYFVRTLWLGVWEHNLKARQFYEKEGFSAFGEHTFKVGTQEDRDLLLAKLL
ncbi:GNAT family N-acetyltransferase [Chitinophaga sp. SYP-B3965]|uniref:GNAT family N-acetyltransferase n=1 Tax=Chitinophaga sp. SYP-B3965 TaxID=2663120 RepID=UPI001299BD30|nr:GNAT family N-acetyltransferase [Chitinophaga sp. SYP-B3965]MRG44590.1 GNAT family N-acetyltransferase [Chitinophaga sp. SYP-B3965]